MRFLCFFFTLSFFVAKAQEISQKTFSSSATKINIDVSGLDELIIENSKTHFISIFLKDQNPNTHGIIVEEKKEQLNLSFALDFLPQDETVFRKYITKRIERATVIIKLPKDKNLKITGKTADIISKGYDGDLEVYLENGLVNLNTVIKNATVKIIQGNVFATIDTSTSVVLNSNLGKIVINNKEYKKTYQKEVFSEENSFIFKSIYGNVTLKQ